MVQLPDEPPRQPSNREILRAIQSVEFVLSELREAVEERIRREEPPVGSLQEEFEAIPEPERLVCPWCRAETGDFCGREEGVCIMRENLPGLHDDQ